MSYSRDQRKKATKRAADAENPERKRIRNQIRNGILPRYKVEKVVTKNGPRSRTDLILKSVFAHLTAKKAEA